MKVQQTCCFTGHRPEGLPFKTDETHPDCVKLKERLRQEIERLITEEGVRHFISGMAAGTGLIAAELVLELKKTQSPMRNRPSNGRGRSGNNTIGSPDSAMKASHCRTPIPVDV